MTQQNKGSIFLAQKKTLNKNKIGNYMYSDILNIMKGV